MIAHITITEAGVFEYELWSRANPRYSGRANTFADAIRETADLGAKQYTFKGGFPRSIALKLLVLKQPSTKDSR